MIPGPYPVTVPDRDAWILSRRPDRDPLRRALPMDRPAGWLREIEPDDDGRLTSILTVFLTNRECPVRCLMCDLWQHTTLEPVPPGAVPAQLRRALDEAGPDPGRWLKLYNAGSFFDAGAIPPADHPVLGDLGRPFERVIVECHPSLVGDRVLRFRDRLGGAQLEVAMGLETAHPEVLARLNKRMNLDDFARATGFLCRHQIAVRAFILIRPPFLDEAEARLWARRSVEFAFAAGVEVVSLIPTRGGAGALEELGRAGQFAPPRLETVEQAMADALDQRQGRVLVDLWDLERLAPGQPRFAERCARLEEMNRRQLVLPPVIE
jgi:radical SAM enzyme (TIGR01210 family)